MNCYVIYSIAQSRVRRVVVPGEGESIEQPGMLAGEACMIVDSKGSLDTDVLNKLISAYTGKPTLSDLCAVVDPLTNKVEAVISADPAIDSLPGKALMLGSSSAGAVKVGDTVALP
jgi:hypothetical protein